jgi:hypothetical protein
LRETFPEAGPYRYVILDRDAKFDSAVITFLQSAGLTPKRRRVEHKPSPDAVVNSNARLGGLHHRYSWCEAV